MNPKLKELKAQVDAATNAARELVVGGDHYMMQVYRQLSETGKTVQRRVAQFQSVAGEAASKRPKVETKVEPKVKPAEVQAEAEGEPVGQKAKAKK